MVDFDDNTMVLIVSDVHLGAFGGDIKQFEDFLRQLRSKIRHNENFEKNFKALIINGDFFDLCMESIRDLSVDYRYIYSFLKTLDKHYKINIIFTLGNHEIPITWGHDLNFSRRKKKFLHKFNTEFKKNNLNYPLFDEANFCQYVILGGNAFMNWEISLYDKKRNFKKKKKKNSSTTRNLNITFPQPLQNKFLCLLTHGYQFDPWVFYFTAWPVWSRCIKSKDKIKELLNNFYNYRMKHPDLFLKKWLKYQENLFVKRKIGKLRRRNEKSEERRGNILHNEGYSNNIKKFLKKRKYLQLTNVIYGHTHNYQDNTKITIKGNPKCIANSGGWQNVDCPSFVEILIDGKINTKNYEKFKLSYIGKALWKAFLKYKAHKVDIDFFRILVSIMDLKPVKFVEFTLDTFIPHCIKHYENDEKKVKRAIASFCKIISEVIKTANFEKAFPELVDKKIILLEKMSEYEGLEFIDLKNKFPKIQ